MINKYRWWELVFIYAGMALFLVFVLAPFAEAFFVSMRPIDAVFRIPYRFFTEDMSFQAYRDMWTSVPMLGRYIFNSLFIALCVTLLALFCIIPAAYSFSRFEYRMRDGLLGAFLAINMIGAAVLIIPLYKLMMTLGLLNSYLSMIIPGAAFTVPTGIFLMRSYFLRIPKELEEAAIVDGASRLYTLWRVILPVSLPGIMVVAITTFINAYAQQFLFALTFNSVNALNPLPVGLYQFFGRQAVVWNELMAASLVGILPVLIVYVFLQRYVVAGLTSGAVKE
ncbi:carbohydrate ABC transporter permease [Pseudoroseicyclus aestuarii]|uniref:Carbohydrate ABC transporter membrane protein 2 (CUT1 family) n=1 Tax=Pseudoroseicyclus aestuarii TaxID=1795041 RepID=A0A318SZ27_9RHOB|nr:carbohydrate ABC transporter permease [Pseudoroseicyclus aestuarii]PYE85679.1 carbohydrate ABC transporter membrane protein 2 (CUT1 family) [Pseudoroseicyclus aestuarii]